MPTKKAPVKKKPATKATSVTKKKTAVKKVVTKRKSPAKKKHPFARLLEIRKKGSITKKGVFVSIAVVAVIGLGVGGYALAQNLSANASGHWKYVGLLKLKAVPSNNHSPASVSVSVYGCSRGYTKIGYSVSSKIVVVSFSRNTNYVPNAAAGFNTGKSKNHAVFGPNTALRVGATSIAQASIGVTGLLSDTVWLGASGGADRLPSIKLSSLPSC